MQQTDNLHLNIWSPQDAVDVEQINSNFQALDKAHASLTQEQEKTEDRFPKMLLDVTSESQARQVDLDLSKINLTDYDWIDLKMDLQGEGMGGGTMCMRVNSDATYSYSVEEQSGHGTSFDIFHLCASDETNIQNVRFYCGTAAVFTGFVTCVVGRDVNTYTTRCSIAIEIPTSEVQSLNLFAQDEGFHIPAGSRFRIWGVKL